MNHSYIEYTYVPGKDPTTPAFFNLETNSTKKQKRWYNTTYALYGAMILLHLILSGFPGINEEEPLKDVEKSLEIFDSMTNIVVARRCSEMIREVLEVARACVATRRAVSAVPVLPPHVDTNIESSSLETNNDQNVHTRTDMAPLVSQGVDGDFFFSLLLSLVVA